MTSEPVPSDYAAVLDAIKNDVRSARHRTLRVVNTELLSLYWRIGRAILDRQGEQGWGAKIIDRLSVDLQREFPDMTGLSRSNLDYMRRFAAAYAERALSQQPVGKMGWGHITILLDKLSDQSERDWYAAQAAQHGWSRAVLTNQIKNQTRARIGAAPSNFPAHLPAEQSELAQQLAKDPLIFSFLGLTGQVSERDLEQALMEKLTATLLELGHGFAFVGRQVHFDIDGDDFYIDVSDALPWTSWLPADERAMFITEFVRTAVASQETGLFSPLTNLIASWKATAEIHQNPELAELRAADRGPDELVALTRPTL